MAARPFSVSIPVTKIDAPQGLLTGWASIVSREDGTPIIDSDGDIILAADLEKAAQDAFRTHGGKAKVGDMHERSGTADLVESMVMTHEKQKAMFGKVCGPEGWAVTIKVTDPETLKKIREGERPEFSIKGTAKEIPI